MNSNNLTRLPAFSSLIELSNSDRRYSTSINTPRTDCRSLSLSSPSNSTSSLPSCCSPISNHSLFEGHYSHHSSNGTSGSPSEGIKEKGLCKVCGEKAFYQFYGTLACDSCRTFFRRTVLQSKYLSCDFNERCEVTYQTRKECSKCRLVKCLMAGMRVELVAPSEQQRIRRGRATDFDKLAIRTRQLSGGQDDQTITGVVTSQVDTLDHLPQIDSIAIQLANQDNRSALLNKDHCTYRSDSTTEFVGSKDDQPSDGKVKGHVAGYSERQQNEYFAHCRSASTFQNGHRTDLNPPAGGQTTGQYSTNLTTSSSSSVTTKLSGTTQSMSSNRTVISNTSNPSQTLRSSINRTPSPVVTTGNGVCSIIAVQIRPSKLFPKGSHLTSKFESNWMPTKNAPNTFKLTDGSFSTNHVLEFSSSKNSHYATASPIDRHYNLSATAVIKGQLGLRSPLERTLLYEVIKASEQFTSHFYEIVSKKNEVVVAAKMLYLGIERVVRACKLLSPYGGMADADKAALLRGGCSEMLLLRSLYHVNLRDDCWEFDVNKLSGDVSRRKLSLKIFEHGQPATKGTVYLNYTNFVKSIEEKWRTDNVVLTILLAIVLFSPHREDIVDQPLIKNNQRVYCHLLKRYLESLVGPSQGIVVYGQLNGGLDRLKLLRESYEAATVDLSELEVGLLHGCFCDLSI